MSLSQYSKEEIQEMSLIELAYDYLAGQKQAIPFSEIIDEIKRLQDLSDEDLKSRLAQFYTDLNIDGRFTSLGENRWGLKAWYPVDQIEDEVLPAAKPKKKKAKAADEDELEDFDEIDEDLDFDEDFEEEDEEDLVEDDDDLIDDDEDDDEEEENLEEALEDSGFMIDEDEADLDEEDEDEDLEEEKEDDDKL
ncbi:DNA-directed RNA polymerase subunit delta [Peribacillus kribbensis]|uniref:DNA-directed RNA polymerase subunit delta n=1 Tax=Peribacillus kribbensis TaxID=356658 RepID=UPI000401FFC6|nr:DNA-directed RNA polymerase subunit delta [Peribacillus kribbensis]